VSAFIDERRGDFGVEPICRALDVSASAYYQRKTGQRSDRVVEDERLTGRIRETHLANYEAYGYRRVHAQLVREGETVGRDQVVRLMRRAGVEGAKRRGKAWQTTTPDPLALRPADLVRRAFTAVRPDLLWVCDFVRHEALFDRAGMKGTPPSARRSEPFEAGGSLIRGTPMRVDSSPDNDGTGRYCQTVRVRLAR
jgi:hypothetical protein